MAKRFDVFTNPGKSSGSAPLLLNIQSDLLDGLQTRIVIPMSPSTQYSGIDVPDDLMPTFTIKGKRYVLETPKMGAVPTNILREHVGSLVQHQLAIVSAVDRLLHGF